MSLFYFRDLEGKKRTYSTVTAAKKGARMFADRWGVSVEVFEEVGGTGRKVTAKRNPAPKTPNDRFIVADPRTGKTHHTLVMLTKSAATRIARERGWKAYNMKDYTWDDYDNLVGPQHIRAKRNPAMLGGSVLSRSKSALASGYLSLIKTARAKGSKRLRARPRRSVEHRSPASNANSVLKTVRFKQPVNGRVEEVAGLTTKEAQKLADQLRSYGLTGVSVI